MNVIGYTEGGSIRVVFDGDEDESIVPDDVGNRDRQMIADWEAKGNTIPPFKEPDASVLDYESAIQSLVDETAREKQFRDGVTMASYVASTKEQWAAEAQAFVGWRDRVWSYAYLELAKVQAGERYQPSVDDFLAEIEPIVWPEG